MAEFPPCTKVVVLHPYIVRRADADVVSPTAYFLTCSWVWEWHTFGDMKVVQNIKAADLQRLGVSKPYSHQLLAGGKTPSLALAQKLERELGISTNVWPLPPKRVAANDTDTPSQEAA